MALLLSLVFYFAPALLGYARKHKNREAIGILNLIFGWTGVGWVLCLIWAMLK